MENYFEKIQDYLDDVLRPEERSAFELELSLNDALREEVFLQQQLNNALSKHLKVVPEEKLLRETLKKAGIQHKVSQKGTGNRPFRWSIGLAAAACLALVLILAGVFSSSDLAQLPEMPSVAVRGNELPEDYSKAQTLFNSGHYEASTLLLHKLYNKSENEDVTLRYYLGLSYLGLKQYDSAIVHLSALALGQSVYQPDALYFAGLAYHQSGNTNEAVQYLEKVSANNLYYKKAQKLLRRMED